MALLPPNASRGGIFIRAEDLHDLGLAVPNDLPEALAPFNRLVQRLHPNHRPAAQQLLQLDKRPIGHSEAPAREPEACALRLERPRRDQHAGLHRLPNELSHLGHELRGWGSSRLRVVLRIIDQELHVRSSLWSGAGPPGGLARRYALIVSR